MFAVLFVAFFVGLALSPSEPKVPKEVQQIEQTFENCLVTKL